MHKIYTLLLAGLLANISVVYASNTIDSIGVENNKGKKLIIHKVEAKETYYSIAKKYRVGYKDVMTFNESKLLQVGIVIKVPTEISFTAISSPAPTNSAAVIDYTIKAKDNLNMLAERYGTTVDEIKRVNGLRSINLQIGQVLKIPTNENVAIPIAEAKTPPSEKIVIDNKTTTNEAIANVEHTIKAKENLNLIAEKYGTTVEEIKRINGLSSNNLRIGQVLKISSTNPVSLGTAPENVVVLPSVKPSLKANKEQPVQTNVNNSGGFEHTVIVGETIYSIAKKYGLTTYQLKTANNLSANEVVTGQKLIIKDAKTLEGTDAGTEDDSPTTNPNTIKDPNLKYPASKYGITQVEEKGTAIWIADQDLDPNKMLVLHRSAPVGTIIKVTNPMTNRSAFAKVVGKFTENESTKDVIIVMTKAVADAVGALDKRFFCNINYGAQENEQQ
ncbi:LysM peptidoglycan-binding domain-containing protein [Pedobacter polaris]|uniref:LysM peptidoglycan-binding domain-containing protein n=1 Tax=Pedobacter polaris TaxID=2571273 RepID=A0A4U1CHM3_9SPHI|nr:LysM peptidoglycan-binding domain-containing protein [Pedobacter polaris]TKC06771.1 LysM peptidoglycan-binding domain-containing protein [Pedobacter polaris]